MKKYLERAKKLVNPTLGLLLTAAIIYAALLIQQTFYAQPDSDRMQEETDKMQREQVSFDKETLDYVKSKPGRVPAGRDPFNP